MYLERSRPWLSRGNGPGMANSLTRSHKLTARTRVRRSTLKVKYADRRFLHAGQIRTREGPQVPQSCRRQQFPDVGGRRRSQMPALFREVPRFARDATDSDCGAAQFRHSPCAFSVIGSRMAAIDISQTMPKGPVSRETSPFAEAGWASWKPPASTRP